jgi:hypothetical protein
MISIAPYEINREAPKIEAFAEQLSKSKKTGKYWAILMGGCGVGYPYTKSQENQRVTTLPIRGNRSQETRRFGSWGRFD